MADKSIPTKERLARAIEQRRGSEHYARADLLVKRARAGYYDDFESELELPQHALVAELRKVGYDDLAERVINGDFDATQEEAEAWMEREGFDFLTGRRK